MKRIAIALGIVVGLAAAFGLLQLGISESGEVIVLTTTDAEGETATTRLWIVEHDGDVWLRSGQGDASGWYARILEQPRVEVERAGETASYLAQPTPDALDTINPLLREKYGWADEAIDAMFGVGDAIPVRLMPR